MLLGCCRPHLSRESVWPRRRPPCPVCPSCAQTVSGFCSTGRWQASESCWTKSGGLCWRSPNIRRLCPGTSGGVIGGSRSHCRSICRQWWSRPASGKVNQMSVCVLTRCHVNARQKKEAYWVTACLTGKTGSTHQIRFIHFQVRLASETLRLRVVLCSSFIRIVLKKLCFPLCTFTSYKSAFICCFPIISIEQDDNNQAGCDWE